MSKCMIYLLLAMSLAGQGVVVIPGGIGTIPGSTSGGSGGSSPNLTLPSILQLPELTSNGSSSVWWVGNPSQASSTCYVLPGTEGVALESLTDSGTTTSIDPDGSGSAPPRTCRILSWSKPTQTIRSAKSATTTPNLNAFESLASISLPAMSVGASFRLDFILSNIGGSNVNWDFEPRVGATALLSERDPSAGADDYSAASMTCKVISSSLSACTGMYTRANGAVGAMDWNTSGAANFSTSIDFTTAQTLQLWVQQRAVTTDPVFLMYTVTVNAAL